MRFDSTLHVTAATVAPGVNGADTVLTVSLAMAPLCADPVAGRSPAVLIRRPLQPAEVNRLAEAIGDILGFPVKVSDKLQLTASEPMGPAVLEPVEIGEPAA